MDTPRLFSARFHEKLNISKEQLFRSNIFGVIVILSIFLGIPGCFNFLSGFLFHSLKYNKEGVFQSHLQLNKSLNK